LVYISPGFTTPLLYLQTDKLKFSTPYIGLMETIEGGFGIAAAAVYAILCRKFNLRRLLSVSIAATALSTLLYLGYSHSAAPYIHALTGFAVICAEVSLMDLAIRATPRGCESLGFSLMMSARNFALQGSDVIGSWLLDSHGWQFHQLVWLNAGTTALVLIFIPLLPAVLMDRKEGSTNGDGGAGTAVTSPQPAIAAVDPA
jgi:predicted MFS family arabinose efflux permease